VADKEKPKEFIIQFFSYVHLPPHLAEISKPFCDLANNVIMKLPSNSERSVALRKLLESKDAAVRAFIAKDQETQPPPVSAS